MDRKAPYIVSKTKDGDAWYCHMRGYPNIPVFGSIGDKTKANKVCRMMNKSSGFGKGR